MTYDNFGAAVGVPMAIILPVIAILSVTSEWSQRSGLTTFTLVPKRGAGDLGQAADLGRAGCRLDRRGTRHRRGRQPGRRRDRRDRPGLGHLARPGLVASSLANVLGLLIGFMLGVLIRNSAGGHRGVLRLRLRARWPAAVLAASQEWFRDLQPWIDFNYTQGLLFEGWPVGGEAGHSSASPRVVWLVLPLVVGLCWSGGPRSSSPVPSCAEVAAPAAASAHDPLWSTGLPLASGAAASRSRCRISA